MAGVSIMNWKKMVVASKTWNPRAIRTWWRKQCLGRKSFIPSSSLCMLQSHVAAVSRKMKTENQILTAQT